MDFQIFGWVGVVAFVGSYLLLSLEIISSKKPIYHWLNFIGAVCLVINGIFITDHPTIVVNGIWGLIALITVFKIVFGRTTKTS